MKVVAEPHLYHLDLGFFVQLLIKHGNFVGAHRPGPEIQNHVRFVEKIVGLLKPLIHEGHNGVQRSGRVRDQRETVAVGFYLYGRRISANDMTFACCNLKMPKKAVKSIRYVVRTVDSGMALRRWSPPSENTLPQVHIGGQYPFFQLHPVLDPNETVRRLIAVPWLIEKKRLNSGLL